jgi:hypothetical protein
MQYRNFMDQCDRATLPGRQREKSRSGSSVFGFPTGHILSPGTDRHTAQDSRFHHDVDIAFNTRDIGDNGIMGRANLHRRLTAQ